MDLDIQDPQCQNTASFPGSGELGAKALDKGATMPHSPHTAPMPAILLLGPTGSGKTPLGERLEQGGLGNTPCVHFDFGAQLRAAVARGESHPCLSPSELDFLRTVLETGALLEDEHFPIALRILQSFRIDRCTDPTTLVVLNGLPRHLGQARALEGMVEVRAVVELQCSAETVWQRLHQNTGGDRTGRDDDHPEAVGAKLAIFQQRTAPLVEYYAAQGVRRLMIQVAPEMVAEQMVDHLRQRI